MNSSNASYRPAQPIGEAAGNIMYRCIVNAQNKSDQKAFIMTCYECGYFSVAETFAWMAALQLQAE